MIIYKATNKINGKAYVGRYSNAVPDKRWDRHCKSKDNTYFHNAIKKYGADNFTLETLCECDTWEILGIIETFKIMVHKTHYTEGGYNLTWGNDGCYGLKHTEKTKQKIRISSTGRKHSEETLEKMSENQIGKNNSFYGKTHSNKTKQIISEKSKNHIVSEEIKNKIQLSKIGKHLSKEHKQKLSILKIKYNHLIPIAQKMRTDGHSYYSIYTTLKISQSVIERWKKLKYFIAMSTEKDISAGSPIEYQITRNLIMQNIIT